MQNKMMKLEIAGIFFIIIMSVFLQNLFALTNRNLLGVMFGSVNNSIWEITKTLLFPYLLWSMLELLSIRPPFRRFVVTKTIALYSLGVSYIILCLIISVLGLDSGFLPEFIAAVVCISASLCLSYRLLNSRFNLSALFYPSIFMLLLFLAVYLSFTTFPPQIYIFMDRDTCLYGIIPEYIDKGAIALDTFYGIQQ